MQWKMRMIGKCLACIRKEAGKAYVTLLIFGCDISNTMLLEQFFQLIDFG
jgi:hypothetical protein